MANTKVPKPATAITCSAANRPSDAGREQPGLDHAGRDVGGEEQVVELEDAAERDQDHHGPDGAGRGQSIEPGGDFSRLVGVDIDASYKSWWCRINDCESERSARSIACGGARENFAASSFLSDACVAVDRVIYEIALLAR